MNRHRAAVWKTRPTSVLWWVRRERGMWCNYERRESRNETTNKAEEASFLPKNTFMNREYEAALWSGVVFTSAEVWVNNQTQ